MAIMADTRETLREFEDGRGRAIGFVEQMRGGHWSSYSYTAMSGLSAHPNKEAAIAEVRRQHSARSRR